MPSDRCCICELGERPLLDAAHIVPDRLPEGLATVTNGMAMCPTHHRAFDKSILLVNTSYRVEVQRERLERVESEATARMLLDFDGKEIRLPKQVAFRPAVTLLEKRSAMST